MPTPSLPVFPALPEMRRLCRLVTRANPELTLSGHRFTLHELRPHHLPTGRAVLEHVHSYYEAHILLEGSGVYTIGRTETLGPGGALVHSPHTPHAWQESPTPCLRLLICFSMDPVVPVPRPPTWPVWPDLLWDIYLLLAEAEARLPGWDLRATARLNVVLSRLLSMAGWPGGSSQPQAPQLQFVPMIDQFLRDNLARPLTLEDVAVHAGISKRTLCRQFFELTGTTVMERLFNLRMDAAATLLAETDAPLYAIGASVGLPEPSYFCRRFRQHYHITPQTYRRQIAANAKKG